MKTLMTAVILVALATLCIGVANAAVVADSVTGFAGSPNGQNNWSYWQWLDPSTTGSSAASAYDYTTVQLMADWSGGEWHGTFGGGKHYPYIGASAIMPAGINWGTEYNLWAVRRWDSNVSGAVTISGHLQKNDPYGTGVNAHIYVDGVEKWSQYCTVWDQFDYSINVTVASGSNVDFALDSNGDVSDDESIFTGTISQVPEPSSLVVLAMGSIGGLTILRRRFVS
ncbi:MAG: PEP-CTERM sorting domain-containing protein [Armatimonadetes bacterium]|nr:PEP-CTERM sorting domain-containing protein [Armatimonadota bacterium]